MADSPYCTQALIAFPARAPYLEPNADFGQRLTHELDFQLRPPDNQLALFAQGDA